jgi:hypothetical protein
MKVSTKSGDPFYVITTESEGYHLGAVIRAHFLYVFEGEMKKNIEARQTWQKSYDRFLHLKFNNPKPLGLIEHILTIGSPKNALVLDFFAGSGTTGHAVLNLNSSSNSNRKFILVTNNENNICEDVTFPRIKKAIKGFKEPNGKSPNAAPVCTIRPFRPRPAATKSLPRCCCAKRVGPRRCMCWSAVWNKPKQRL